MSTRLEDLTAIESHQSSETWDPANIPSTNTGDYTVRIHTLGRFSVQLNDSALTLSQGRKQRPLEMLKALVALGGREVHAELLCQALWPDADGDVAQNSFDVTLHRMRKVLGIKDLFILCDRRLTLNSDLAWVDAWEFEKLVNHSERLLSYAGSTDTVNQLVECNEKLLHLYQGSFLEREANQTWTLGLSERLRSKLLRHMIDAGRVCETQQLWDVAIRLYRKGLEVDPLIEELHMHLMDSYRNSGRVAEAIGVFYHCQELLARYLDIEPSDAMMDLYQSMRS